MNSLSQVKKEVDQLVDRLGYPIDNGIKRVVAVLRLVGFHTTASCEGHICSGLPYPWVDINNGPEFGQRDTAERQALQVLLDEFYKDRYWKFVKLARFGIFGACRMMPYDDINMEGDKNPEMRLFYLNSMNEFVEWLLKKYENSRASS